MPFCTYKIKQFILNDNSSKCATIRAVKLLRHWRFNVITDSTVFTIHILIIKVSVGRSMGFISTLFCNGIDTTTSKSTLAYIIRSNYNLYLLNRIHRNRIGSGLITIRSTGRKSEYIVSYCTVYLETIVTIIRTDKSNASYLRSCNQRTVLHNVVNVTAYCRSIFNIFKRKILCCTRFGFSIGNYKNLIQQLRTWM